MRSERRIQEYQGVVKKTKNIWLRAHLFDTAVLSVLTEASETWTVRKQHNEHAVSVIQSILDEIVLGIFLYTQVQGIRSSELRKRMKMKDAVAYGKKPKTRWVEHMRYRDGHWTKAVTDWISRGIKRTP
uniref:Transposase n=1 Tax=Haemonchus contortus TaxID=6289 RepID=A0A7I5E527_HAECO